MFFSRLFGNVGAFFSQTEALPSYEERMMDMEPQEWQAEPSKKTWRQVFAEFFDPV